MLHAVSAVDRSACKTGCIKSACKLLLILRLIGPEALCCGRYASQLQKRDIALGHVASSGRASLERSCPAHRLHVSSLRF